MDPGSPCTLFDSDWKLYLQRHVMLYNIYIDLSSGIHLVFGSMLFFCFLLNFHTAKPAFRRHLYPFWKSLDTTFILFLPHPPFPYPSFCKDSYSLVLWCFYLHLITYEQRQCRMIFLRRRAVGALACCAFHTPKHNMRMGDRKPRTGPSYYEDFIVAGGV